MALVIPAPAFSSESPGSESTATLGPERYISDGSFCAGRAAACLLKIVLISSGWPLYTPSGLAAPSFSDRWCELRWLAANILLYDLL